MNIFGSPDIERMVAENDYEGLYKCLEHNNQLIRLQAAQALADLNDGTGWRYLLDTLRQTDEPALQAVAATLLGELGHPRAAAPLGEALKKARGETADAIRNALEIIRGPEAEEALRRAGYEPVTPQLQGGQVLNFEEHYVRPALTGAGEIRYQTAEEHLNQAVELREAEMTERGLVEDSLALWLSPNWAYAWYLRGVLYDDLERGMEACLAYRHALELDPTLHDAREALEELGVEPLRASGAAGLTVTDLLIGDLANRSWEARRDAAAQIGDLALRGDPSAAAAVDALIACLQDEEREVRQAAIQALGQIGDRRAVLPLLALEESSWLARFSILQSLAQLGSVDGLVTTLHGEMDRIQNRNPVFSSNKDPLLEVEYESLLEIGVRSLERTGDLESLLQLAEGNAWVPVEGEDEQTVEDEAEGYPLAEDEDEDLQPEEDLEAYVDEVALMAAAALERLALPRLPELPIATLQRLAAVPDLTLLELSGAEEVPGEGIEPQGEPVVVYDLAKLRTAAQAELERRGAQPA